MTRAARRSASRSATARTFENDYPRLEKTLPRLKQRYRDEIKDALNTEFKYANVMQIPGVVKVDREHGCR